MLEDTPLRYDIIFRAGATLVRKFGIQDDLGVRVDMSAWTSDAVVRLTDKYGVPTTVVLQATSSYDATLNEWTLDFPVAVSALLSPTHGGLPMGVAYFWDWKLTAPGGVVYVPLAGSVTVLRRGTL